MGAFLLCVITICVHVTDSGFFRQICGHLTDCRGSEGRLREHEQSEGNEKVQRWLGKKLFRLTVESFGVEKRYCYFLERFRLHLKLTCSSISHEESKRNKNRDVQLFKLSLFKIMIFMVNLTVNISESEDHLKSDHSSTDSMAKSVISFFRKRNWESGF